MLALLCSMLNAVKITAHIIKYIIQIQVHSDIIFCTLGLKKRRICEIV